MKHKKLSLLILVAICILIGLGAIAAYQFGTAEKRHANRAKKAYKTETQEIAKKITDSGIVLQGLTQSCNDLDGDQAVSVNCSYSTSGEISINNALIQKWPVLASDFSNTLRSSGWEKTPNYDPATDNPVDTLDRLLEYKGIYRAYVSYTKGYNSIRCQIYFYVNPISSIQEKPQLEIDLGCRSIAKYLPWL